MGEDLAGLVIGAFVTLGLLFVVIYFAVLTAIREARKDRQPDS